MTSDKHTITLSALVTWETRFAAAVRRRAPVVAGGARPVLSPQEI